MQCLKGFNMTVGTLEIRTIKVYNPFEPNSISHLCWVKGVYRKPSGLKQIHGRTPELPEKPKVLILHLLLYLTPSRH